MSAHWFDHSHGGNCVIEQYLSCDVYSAGVDVADLRRLARAVERSGEALTDRLLTAAEANWVAGDPRRFATVFSLKESVVKVVGGLPSNGRLLDIDVSASPRTGPPELPVRLHGDLARWATGRGLDVRVGLAGATDDAVLTWAVSTPSCSTPAGTR